MTSQATELRTAPILDHGAWMYECARELYPMCRSLTGSGVRQTLDSVRQHIPLAIHEVPSGTQVFDWKVPQEWNVRDAYIRDAAGQKVVDFAKSNLHLVGYSRPVHRKMSLSELREHLFTLPEKPDWIPYRTSYYKDAWGFCLSHNDFLKLGEGEYEVCVDTSLENGTLTYGECFFPGETEEEVFISAHVCHPSLCNDNLSGISVAACLARYVAEVPRRLSYRFLFCPATIGAISWLSRNKANLHKIRHGLVLTCVGDGGHSTYKKSRRSDAEIDRAVLHVLQHSGQHFAIREFTPQGYDERQYCSPGVNLAVGCLMRTPNGVFPEYHTSADNLDLIQPEFLADSYRKCVGVFRILEGNRTYLNLYPNGEPQLGSRGLYFGDSSGKEELQSAVLWVLNMSDGTMDLLSIAERSNTPFDGLRTAADLLIEKGMLRDVSAPNGSSLI